MSRPETIADLDTNEQWEVVAEFNTTPLVVYPDLLGKYAAFMREAEESGGLIMTESYDRSRVKVTMPVPTQELEHRLTVAQIAWDNKQTDYRRMCAELGVSVRVVDGPPRKYLQPEVTEL